MQLLLSFIEIHRNELSDIERGEGSSAYELRFGEQEYTVNEMKQNIVILNQSDKPQHVLIELQEIEYVRPFQVTATTGF